LARLSDVLRILDLTSREADGAESDTFQGNNVYIPTGRTYGGQLVAQAIIAASRTTSEYRLPNSLHAYFMMPGDLNQELTFAVERLRDGAAYSTREVSAFNARGDRAIFKALVSFHEGENSDVDFSAARMPDVKDPHKFKTLEEVFTQYVEVDGKKNEWARYFTQEMPFEVRQVSSSLFLGSDERAKKGDFVQDLAWIKIRDSETSLIDEFCDNLTSFASNRQQLSTGTHDDLNYFRAHYRQLIMRALLAFASDQFALSPALRQGGVSWLNKKANYASLDHSIWFHNDVDLTKWHLFAGSSPAASSARGLGISNVFSSERKVVASFAQEGMIRV
jgi:acyl-CoA thioesterase-2